MNWQPQHARAHQKARSLPIQPEQDLPRYCPLVVGDGVWPGVLAAGRACCMRRRVCYSLASLGRQARSPHGRKSRHALCCITTRDRRVHIRIPRL